MAIDDATDAGQSYAGAFKFIGMMQALEDTKKFINIFHVKTYAVIANRNNVFRGRTGVMDANFRLRPGAGIFDGVG
ncbi:MAG: hypothetical protein JWQ71_4068 [Pedosphaera sp.]|nr:hypothetical protein [Pedosphaera sp.]